MPLPNSPTESIPSELYAAFYERDVFGEDDAPIDDDGTDIFEYTDDEIALLLRELVGPEDDDGEDRLIEGTSND